jgi:Peptidase_C39 like family
MTDTSNLSTSGVAAPPSYGGPREVLVNKPVTLKGSYDAARVTKISLAAEDKFPISVTMSGGTWQGSLPKGFSTAGSRWLRLKGLNNAGKEVTNQVFYITVSDSPLSVGQGMTLKVMHDTFFKMAAIDSSKLTAQQKVLVKAGQTFAVTRYGYLDGHLKLELGTAIAPVGNFGFFYSDHVQLSKGAQILRFSLDEVPTTPTSAQMLVTTTTTMKTKPTDSAMLAANMKTDLMLGQTLQITGYACTGGHWRVTLAQPIANFGSVGFVYNQHVRLVRNGKEIPYDSKALTITALTNTILKKRPVDSAQLQARERFTFHPNQFYGVSSYAVDEGHIKVSLTEELPNFGNTGYVFPNHVQMRRGGRPINPIPPQVELNVPYFSQRDNPRYYWSTCNVTSIAMVMYYYGVRSKDGGQLEDELLQWCLNKGGEGCQTDNAILSQLIQAYGFKTSFSTTRRWQDIKDELINGRPVVVGGLFTHGGHIVTFIGFSNQGYLVNDPWGDALSGYSDTEGRKVLYPYDYVDEVAGPDGAVWAHFTAK